MRKGLTGQIIAASVLAPAAAIIALVSLEAGAEVRSFSERRDAAVEMAARPIEADYTGPGAPALAASMIYQDVVYLPPSNRPLQRSASERAVRVTPQAGRPACVSGRFLVAENAADASTMATYAVRIGPGGASRAIDTARGGERAHACEVNVVDGTVWLGVVYGRGALVCGLDGLTGRERAYAGNCRSGWVRAEDFSADQPSETDRLLSSNLENEAG